MIIRMLHYSGAPKMFLWVAKALAEKGHEVTVCTWSKSDVESLPDNIKWLKLNLEGKGFISILGTIRKVIKEIDADICISFLLDGNVYNTFGCLGRKTKSIICERNDPFKPGYYKLKFWKPLFRFADGAVFQLPKVAEYYNNIKGITAVIPNPVLPKEESHLVSFENRSNIINVLGRLDVSQKRHDVMIEAFAEFVKDYKDFSLVFYGDGPDKDLMQKKINNLCIQDYVRFAGITNTPLDVMCTSKMYILTSDFEGIPNSLIEAMSLGLPCISTDCRPGGAKLLIEDGVNGFVVPPGDAHAIAEKMKWYMKNPHEADSMGNEAKNISGRFSEKNITDLWENYLRKLV